MNFVKKFLRSFFLFLFFLSFNNFVFSDDFDIYSDDNPDMIDFLDHNEPELTKQKPTPDEILDLLVNRIHIDQILQEDIFLRTNQFVKRSLLDNSIFLMDKNYEKGRFVFLANLFYEQTSRMHFSAPCLAEDSDQINKAASCIKSYLALDDPTLLCKIQGLQENIKDMLSILDIPNCVKGFALIKNATVQDRNVGLFFGFEWMAKKFRFRLKTPFYYKERNLFLTNKEIDAISKEFGEGDMDEGMAFARKHLISDQLGLGDLRFEFDYPIASGAKDAELRLGLFTTIPTAVSIVKGLYGEVFKPVTCRPTIDFVTMLYEVQNEATRQKVMDQVTEIGLSALNNLSAMLLQTNLGNGGHFGLGTKLYNTVPMRSIIDKDWMENFALKGMLSAEYMFSHKETRWFVEKDTKELFSKRNFADDTKAAENLAFLEQMTIDRLIPFAYETKVYPGFIFILEEKLAYEKKRWGISIGTDVWVQTIEHFGEICAPKLQIPLLDIEKARKPWAYQWSVFGSLFFKPKKKVGDLYIGLNAEKVISSRGIGQPFKLSLSLERNF
ncbi:MAG: hypothetical protein ACD_82C00187G0003 [uncultured bacterium]|nr:MAG: hypothetical protein ACD_82C00187G0003 [uncultured bacterium]KKP28137.1 MAG: hypothetical protein UR12_C0025G0011 [candidate division TM6 bacterium GW2011_GWF2_30_66]